MTGATETEATLGSPTAELSLPAWTYDNAEFFELERERIFMRSWQVVCHLNDIPNPGDYFVFDFLSEPLVVVRGDDGLARGFYNVCRHRAARLLDGEAGGAAGACPGRIRCPYHAWTYDLRGNLSNVPREAAYPGLDKAAHGLVPLETETWFGFVFVRCEAGGPSVADMMAPFEDEIRSYRFEEMRATGRVTLRPRRVNWKNLTDNYMDGLHISVAHKGLKGIVGRSYALDSREHVQRMSGEIDIAAGAGWSEKAYAALLPDQPHLPPSHKRHWRYYLLWPNIAFDVYPDQIDFMQMIPLSPTETLIREIPYALPDSSREMRLTRYLNWRINRVVNAEDHDLIERVQAGMQSRSFKQGPFSEDEICLTAFARKMRRILPVCRLPDPPPPGGIKASLRTAD